MRSHEGYKNSPGSREHSVIGSSNKKATAEETETIKKSMTEMANLIWTHREAAPSPTAEEPGPPAREGPAVAVGHSDRPQEHVSMKGDVGGPKTKTAARLDAVAAAR